MDFGPDMVRDETHNPLAVGSRQALAGVSQAPCQAVDPQATVGIQHDFHDGWILAYPVNADTHYM
jgi:hypothetical protein